MTLAALVGAWHLAVARQPHSIIPGPWPVVLGGVELLRTGRLFKYVVASLFRVTWGYLLAAAVGIPLGLLLGWFKRTEAAVGPLFQFLRPISPLAWTPLAILWFGVGDLSAVFLIFLASFLPLTLAAINAVHHIDPIHLRAGRNFGLSEAELVRRVLAPAVMPELIVALRVVLGIAWLVVVAAEMIAVNSGLGFLIVESRNAGNRYDLVLGGMVSIGLIGLLLDTVLRRLEKLPVVQWGSGVAS